MVVALGRAIGGSFVRTEGSGSALGTSILHLVGARCSSFVVSGGHRVARTRRVRIFVGSVGGAGRTVTFTGRIRHASLVRRGRGGLTVLRTCIPGVVSRQRIHFFLTRGNMTRVSLGSTVGFSVRILSNGTSGTLMSGVVGRLLTGWYVKWRGSYTTLTTQSFSRHLSGFSPPQDFRVVDCRQAVDLF